MKLRRASPVIVGACVLLTACAQPPRRPRYPEHVTVLVFPAAGTAAGACAVATIPHSVQVSITDHDSVVWDVVDDACKVADFQVTSSAAGFTKYFEAPVADRNEVTRHLRKRAALKSGVSAGAPEAFKYAVEVRTAAGQTVREDPEIVIWP